MALHTRLAAFQDRIRFVKSPARDPAADTGAIAGLVAEIIADVRARGDAAVRDYSRRFDGVETGALEITPAERRAAVDELAPQTRAPRRGPARMRRWPQPAGRTSTCGRGRRRPGRARSTASSPGRRDSRYA